MKKIKIPYRFELGVDGLGDVQYVMYVSKDVAGLLDDPGAYANEISMLYPMYSYSHAFKGKTKEECYARFDSFMEQLIAKPKDPMDHEVVTPKNGDNPYTQLIYELK